MGVPVPISYRPPQTQTKGSMKRTLLALACLSAVSIAAMAADDKTNPDNTATNERDRSGETQTSGDQSNSPADLKITQAIRPGANERQRAFNDCEECQGHYC